MRRACEYNMHSSLWFFCVCAFTDTKPKQLKFSNTRRAKMPYALHRWTKLGERRERSILLSVQRHRLRTMRPHRKCNIWRPATHTERHTDTHPKCGDSSLSRARSNNHNHFKFESTDIQAIAIRFGHSMLGEWNAIAFLKKTYGND